MAIHWCNDDKPVRLSGNSRVWSDDGSPLPYVLEYCPGTHKWTARFEGSVLHRGTLQECMSACQLAEADAEAEVQR